MLTRSISSTRQTRQSIPASEILPLVSIFLILLSTLYRTIGPVGDRGSHLLSETKRHISHSIDFIFFSVHCISLQSCQLPNSLNFTICTEVLFTYSGPFAHLATAWPLCDDKRANDGRMQMQIGWQWVMAGWFLHEWIHVRIPYLGPNKSCANVW